MNSYPLSRRSSSTHTLIWMMLVATLLAPTIALAQDQFVRIVNRWKPALQLNTERGPVTAAPVDPNWESAVWIIEPVAGENYVRLQNRQSRTYLHTEHEQLEMGRIQPDWWSAMWELMPASEGYVRLRNRHLNAYLHVEDGPLALGEIDRGWWSAMWELKPQTAYMAQPQAAQNPSISASGSGFTRLLDGNEYLVGEADLGYGAIDLERQIAEIQQLEHTPIKTTQNGAWQWADFVRTASGTEIAGTATFGHIQGMTYSPRWGYLVTETATPGNQNAYLLGLQELGGGKLQGYLVGTPPHVPKDEKDNSYVSNIDASGDYFVVATTKALPIIYRIGEDASGNTRIRKQCTAPGQATELWALLAYHPVERRMYYYDGAKMYRAAVRGGVFCNANGAQWEALEVDWPTGRVAEEMESTSMIYDRSSGDFFIFEFNWSGDDTYAAYERLRWSGGRFKVVGSAPTAIKLRFPAVHPFISFRSAGAAGTTPQGRLVMAVPYHTLLADPAGVVTLDTIKLQGYQWTTREPLAASPSPIRSKPLTSSDFVGNLMCAVDDRARSKKSWVRLGSGAGYWPQVSTSFNARRAGILIPDLVWPTGFLLARDVPNQPKSWDIRFAHGVAGAPTYKLGFTAYEEDDRGSWAVAQTTDNGRYSFTPMDSIELIPQGTDGWFRIQGKARSRGLRYLSCRHFEAAPEPREKHTLQWRSSLSEGDSDNPIGQLFRLCRSQDLNQCAALPVPN
ncbi:MAG: RICIN domain-containing protein [Xanthomonadales bacterium]|nr:RICIN domain-containing protein [Xanthomonadales bacterium]